MKQIQKRMLAQILLGFLLGRVVFFGSNPVGIAFFAAGFSQGGAVFPLAVSIFLGMLSALGIEAVLRYGAAMVAAALPEQISRHCRLICSGSAISI